MEKLLEKLSSYNIFNYLFPGMIFCILLEKTTSYSIIQENIVIDVFLAYFIGLLISRISSLIIEPLLKKVKFVKFAEYKDFVLASENDSKIELLSESNNMYRVFISLFFLLLIISFLCSSNFSNTVLRELKSFNCSNFPLLKNFELHVTAVL